MKMLKCFINIPSLFQKKIHSTSGETIAETLVTMIILSLAVLMLAGAVVTSARINSKADNTDTAFTAAATTSPSEGYINFTYESGSEKIYIPINYYKTGNDYIYYEAK